MRRSKSLVTTVVAVAVTAAAIQGYIRLKQSYPDGIRSIRAARKPPPPPPPDELPGPTDLKEEYRVLSSLLSRMDACRFVPPVLRQGPDRGDWSFSPGSAKSSPEAQALADLAVKDRQPYLFENRFCCDVRLLSPQESGEILAKQRWWDEFQRRFPEAGSLYSLSRVGFSRCGGLAVVRVGRSDSGETLLLMRTPSGWKRVRSLLRWIA